MGGATPSFVGPGRGATVVFALAIAALGCSGDGPASASPPEPPDVSVVRPLVRELVEWDRFTGRLEAVETVDVRARVSGFLESVHFEDGALVEQGQLLYVIDQRPFEAELERRRGERDRAASRAELARRLLARSERLLERNATSQEEVDTRASEVDQAEAELRAAEAAVDAAELDLEFTEVHAPIHGRIGEDLVNVGNLINGGTALSTLLTTIVSLDPIHCYFDAAESQFLKYVRLSQSGERPSSRDVENPVFLGLSDESGYPHRGYMDFVDNRLDPETGTMRGRALFANPDHLLTPGLFARVLLPGSALHEVLLVPESALSFDQTTVFVSVVGDDGAVQARPVVLGPEALGLRVVRAGLSADDRVIVGGLQRVRPGMRVRPIETSVDVVEDDGLPDLDGTPPRPKGRAARER